MTINICVHPPEQWSAANGYHPKDYDPDLTQQVNEQGILSKYFKEICPADFVTKVNNIKDGSQDDTVKSNRVQHKGAGPKLFIDGERWIPEIGKGHHRHAGEQ